MFRDVPECSGMFHVPGFIDDLTNHRLAFLAERQPRVKPAISTVLLHRLAVVTRHMIVWRVKVSKETVVLRRWG